MEPSAPTVTGSPSAPGPPVGRRARRRLRWVWGAGLLLALAAVWVLPLVAAQGRLRAGADRLASVSALASAGDVAGADRALAAAEGELRAVEAGAAGLLLRIEGGIPLLGRTADGVRTLAGAGAEVASAGREVSGALLDLPGGVSALAPSGGGFPLEPLSALGAPVGDAARRLRAAAGRLRGVGGLLVLGPVSEAARDAADRVSRAARTLDAARALVEALPRFAGADGPRRYLLAVQNPAELRGTGGFIGAYAIVTFDRGAVSVGPFRDVASLPNVPQAELPSPAPGFERIYGRFGGAGFWRNVNMTPDAPTAGRAIERLYAAVRGERLDGTIFVTPQALAAMLGATGPIRDPVLGITLDASDVVPYVTNRAYATFDDPAERKRVLGMVAARVLERFLAGGDGTARLRTLAGAAAEGSLVLHAADPAVQRAFLAAGIAGALGPPGGSRTWTDFLGVFSNDATGTKVDAYVDRAIGYRVRLRDGGSASAEATVTLANHAPVAAPGGEVLGPYPGSDLGPGDDLSWVATYGAPGCRLEAASVDGGPGDVSPYREAGHPMFLSLVRTDRGEERTLGYAFELPNAWDGTADAGTYRLRLRGQPTIRPTEVIAEIRAPAGMRIVATDPAMRVSDGVARWTGTLVGAVELEVRFERPLLQRLWRDVWGFLTRPVLRL